jgi:hypothetical protein
VGCADDGPVTALELPDEVAEDDEGDEVVWSLPQPLVAVPTTMVATAQPATVIRASSMGIPSTSIQVRRGVDAQRFDRGA